MKMSKSVLLARPHPLVSKEMKPFLEHNSFTPRKIDSLTDLKANSVNAAGAVISLDVSSSINESAEEVFSEIRKLEPRLPILFAAMLDFSAMKGALRRIAKISGFEATILGIDPASDNHPDLGKPNTLLYLSMGDLTTPKKSELAARIVQQHFR